ncbi:unnamed protein product [Blepharisma stoltei]|uniref:Uncharacterized protein n=1 Tax=Blepharisma stoltei TaxID=1481888 RepID=A0AAU9JFI9_9CILI|nr:unnamed protein product [Blepharisma stoltei]
MTFCPIKKYTKLNKTWCFPILKKSFKKVHNYFFYWWSILYVQRGDINFLKCWSRVQTLIWQDPRDAMQH